MYFVKQEVSGRTATPRMRLQVLRVVLGLEKAQAIQLLAVHFSCGPETCVAPLIQLRYAAPFYLRLLIKLATDRQQDIGPTFDKWREAETRTCVLGIRRNLDDNKRLRPRGQLSVVVRRSSETSTIQCIYNYHGFLERARSGDYIEMKMQNKRLNYITFVSMHSISSMLQKVEERVGKPPVGRPRSGTVGATGLLQGRRVGGYHSEGYFSSDQDDEGPRRTELKSPRSPRTPELQSPQTPQRIVRSTSQDSAKGASLRMRTPSPDNSSRASHAMTLNESASYLIEKMMSCTPETQRKQVGKTEGRSCCKTDKKPTVAEFTGRSKSEKGCKNSKMTPEARKQSNSANSLSSCQTFEVKEETEVKEEKDDVSEAGTYTIEKDSPSPEVEQARNDIDRVFGVSGPESEADATPATPRGNIVSEESWTTSSDAEKFKSPSSISRSSPNWIQQWAAQVAEHTKSPDNSVKNSLGSPRGHKPPLASLSSSQESSDSRPRRKLPTLPTHHTPFSVTSPRASDMSDHESPTKGRVSRLLAFVNVPSLRIRAFEVTDSFCLLFSLDQTCRLYYTVLINIFSLSYFMFWYRYK
ncbi:centrosomal protein of 170 kDa protein B-like [Penaeus indicus]|uniref:centrosomal protein of 170 kDa protein B-like n=1 Tax=Penaeus indicus TaxID=29960 RepID=UPI00300D62BE